MQTFLIISRCCISLQFQDICQSKHNNRIFFPLGKVTFEITYTSKLHVITKYLSICLKLEIQTHMYVTQSKETLHIIIFHSSLINSLSLSEEKKISIQSCIILSIKVSTHQWNIQDYGTKVQLSSISELTMSTYTLGICIP